MKQLLITTPNHNSLNQENSQSSPQTTESTNIQPQQIKSGPKRTATQLFGAATNGVAGARYSGSISEYRPSFAPSAIDFNSATKANIYVDLEHYDDSSNQKSWFDVKWEMSIEYGHNKGFYIYSIIGNREKWWSEGKYGILGKIKEKHKIVYLSKNGNDWSIDQGFLYEDEHQIYPDKPVTIMKQTEETRTELEKQEIKGLCTSYYRGCGEIQYSDSTKWSAQYTMNAKKAGIYFPWNPFNVKTQNGYELNGVWRYWRWNPHQYRFNGVYDKHAREGEKWQIPRRGMYMGWSAVQLIAGAGNWKRVCMDTTDSCGLNTYPMAAAVTK